MMKLIGRSNKVGHLSAPDRQTDQQVILLNVGQCFSDSLDALIQRPLLLLSASLLTVLVGGLSGGLLVGSLYAGLVMVMLKAMDDDTPSLGDLFGQMKSFAGFAGILLSCLVAVLVGVIVALTPFVLMNWHAVFWNEALPLFDRFGEWIAQVQQVSWGFRLAFMSLAVGVWYFIQPRLFFGVQCFYMLPLKAERVLPGDEAYVESKKAVQRCGFKQHVMLVLIVLWMIAIFVEGLVGAMGSLVGMIVIGVLFVFLQPFLLGLVASAYRQTLRVEAHQQEQHEEHVVEMIDELKTARDMQLSLLPSKDPEIAGYELDDICIPANAVCGDYYSYRWLDDRYFALIAADVSGKAMQAAVTAVRFNEMLRYECKGRIDPAEILDGLDASLEDQIEMTSFVTCCVVVLDTHTNTIEIANAGHCEPCIYSHGDEEAKMISLSGFPLGLARSLRAGMGYEKVKATLEPGDTLVLYSDGVVEAQDRDGEHYEESRLVNLLDRAGKRLGPGEIINRVVQEVGRHIGDGPQSDDISLIALKRHENVIDQQKETEGIAVKN